MTLPLGRWRVIDETPPDVPSQGPSENTTAFPCEWGAVWHGESWSRDVLSVSRNEKMRLGGDMPVALKRSVVSAVTPPWAVTKNGRLMTFPIRDEFAGLSGSCCTLLTGSTGVVEDLLAFNSMALRLS